MKDNDVLLSSASDEWETPPELYKELDDQYHFNFDPCPLGCWIDGLSTDWGTRVFINPPYSDIGTWVKRAYEEFREGKTIVMLIPARTDTIWFHAYVMRAPRVDFIEGRLEFYGKIKKPGQKGVPKEMAEYVYGLAPATFPSMIVYFDPELEAKRLLTVTTFRSRQQSWKIKARREKKQKIALAKANT